MNAEEISSTNFIESQLREFYTKNKQGKGEGFGRRLLELYRKAHASKMPSEKEMRDKYTDLREKHGLFDAFRHFRIWLISFAKPSKKP